MIRSLEVPPGWRVEQREHHDSTWHITAVRVADGKGYSVAFVIPGRPTLHDPPDAWCVQVAHGPSLQDTGHALARAYGLALAAQEAARRNEAGVPTDPEHEGF